MKTKKKLLVPIAMLVLAVMAVTSATFAWFTTNSTVRGTISNANVVSDGTLLFVVDQEVVWKAAYDDYIATSAAIPATPTAQEIAAATAAGYAALNTSADLDDTANWAFSTNFDYAASNLEMLDLTYSRDNDWDRYIINLENDPRAGALRALAPTDYWTVYAGKTSDASLAADLLTYIGAFDGSIATAPTLVGKEGLASLPASTDITAAIAVANVALSPAVNATDTGTYFAAYVEERAAQIRTIYTAEYNIELAYAIANATYTPTPTDWDSLSSTDKTGVHNAALAAVAAATTVIDDAAHAAADAYATTQVIAVLTAQAATNDTVWTSAYNTSYGSDVIPYTGAYKAEYEAALMALTGTLTITDAEAAATIRQLNSARATAAVNADRIATAAADAALTGKVTTIKLDAATADAAYSHYGINSGVTNTGSHTLYNKSIFNAKNDPAANASIAKANKDYIDLTYTFWCAAPADYPTTKNKLALDIGDAVTQLSSITSAVKSIPFNGLDLAYFLAQGPTDERVAQFYSNSTGSATATSVPNEIQSADNLYYVFDSAGTYDSSAANASRVMFTNIDQSGTGTDEILGIWEPNATEGYDAVTGGVRDVTLDVQDMYNKAQAKVNFDDLAPIDYVNRYNENTDPKLLTPNIDNDIELISFTDEYPDATGAYYRAQINVKIWLEGFDSDCFNVILGDMLGINLQFNAYVGV